MTEMKRLLPTAAEMKVDATELGVLVNEYRASGVPLLTAVVMAGDTQSARRVDRIVAEGAKPIKCVWMVGSYARFEWARANLTKAQLFRILPQLWIASDPDDTKPEYLELWREAYKRNGNHIITDGKLLPRGAEFKVYRGQIGDVTGISYSLDRHIAKKFSMNGGGRQTVSGGKILTRTIKREHILAFLTGRSESEIIYGGPTK